MPGGATKVGTNSAGACLRALSLAWRGARCGLLLDADVDLVDRHVSCHVLGVASCPSVRVADGKSWLAVREARLAVVVRALAAEATRVIRRLRRLQQLRLAWD